MLGEMFANYICHTKKLMALYTHQLRKETATERNGHRHKQIFHKRAERNVPSVPSSNIYSLNTYYVPSAVLGLYPHRSYSLVGETVNMIVQTIISVTKKNNIEHAIEVFAQT